MKVLEIGMAKHHHCLMNSSGALRMIKGLCGFFVFFGIIHLFYAPILWKGAMFGTWDSWGNLAMFHEVRTFFEAGGDSVRSGQYFAGFENPWINYGLDFWGGIPWVVLTWCGVDAIGAMYWNVVIILSLNALSLYLLLRFLSVTKVVALGLSFALVLNPVMFHYTDWINLLCLFPGIFAAKHLLDFHQNGNLLSVKKACCWIALLLPLNPYGFIFSFTLGVCFFLCHSAFWHATRPLLRNGIFLVGPIVGLYAVVYALPNINQATIIDPLSSLWPHPDLQFHLTSLLKGSTLSYLPPPLKGYEYSFLESKNAFMGYGLSIVAFIGFIRHPRFFIAVLLYLFIACTLDLSFIRVDYRWGLPLLILIPLAAGLGFKEIQSSPFYAAALPVLLFAVIETASFNPRISPQSYPELRPLVQQKLNAHDVVLHLPAGIHGQQKSVRNYQYMILRHQKKTPYSTINGGGFYYPKALLFLYDDIVPGSAGDNFTEENLEKLGITKIILHEELCYDSLDHQQVNLVRKHNYSTIEVIEASDVPLP